MEGLAAAHKWLHRYGVFCFFFNSYVTLGSGGYYFTPEWTEENNFFLRDWDKSNKQEYSTLSDLILLKCWFKVRLVIPVSLILRILEYSKSRILNCLMLCRFWGKYSVVSAYFCFQWPKENVGRFFPPLFKVITVLFPAVHAVLKIKM